MTIELQLFLAGLPVLIGLTISAIAIWRIGRRWFVVSIRMPIKRALRYRPAKPDRIYHY